MPNRKGGRYEIGDREKIRDSKEGDRQKVREQKEREKEGK